VDKLYGAGVVAAAIAVAFARKRYHRKLAVQVLTPITATHIHTHAHFRLVLTGVPTLRGAGGLGQASDGPLRDDGRRHPRPLRPLRLRVPGHDRAGGRGRERERQHQLERRRGIVERLRPLGRCGPRGRPLRGRRLVGGAHRALPPALPRPPHQARPCRVHDDPPTHARTHACEVVG
jgi:hypothetical protein